MDFNSLRNAAGSAISNGIDKVTAAARGLRMPGVGTPQPAAAGAPLPQIDPSLADRAQTTMRAPVAPEPPIPTLTDEIRPGVAGPFKPQPPIPTLSDVHTAGTVQPPAFEPAPGSANPNVPAGGMSAERAAFNAEQGMRMGPPTPPPSIGRTLSGAASDAGRLVKDNLPTRLGMAANGLTAAASFAPHWSAFGDDSGLDNGQKAKLFLRDTSRALGGIVGGAAGASLGSAVPVAGTVAGGAAGGYLGAEAVDAIGGGLRRGANWVNEKLGGSPNYITSTDEDLAAAAAKKGIATPAVKAPVATTPASAAPAAPTDPADVAAFNARMKEIGAPTVGMRVGPDDTRVLGNTAPSDAAMQKYTDQHMADRTAQFAAADQANREQGMRQLAYGQVLQNPDVVKLTDELNNAMRSGSPVAIQAASNARDNLIRTLSADHQMQTQAGVTMRGQDFTLAGQRASNQLGMYNALREQGNADRQFQRESGNDKFTQGEAAEKHLDDALTARFTTGHDKDGKPQIDVAGKNAALAGIQRSAAALGVNSVQDLSKMDRERLIAGSELAAKVNADASNILPWKPDVIGEVMPHDLIGLQKNSSGDYVIPRGAAAGRVIPARYLNKVNADRFGGQPTDIYDNLKAN